MTTPSFGTVIGRSATDDDHGRQIRELAADHGCEVEASDRAKGRNLMVKLIESVSTSVPKALTEVIALGRILTKRAAEVLAYFDRPGASNGPTEAINGRLEHLRGAALSFRNLTNYIVRSLPKTGGFRPQLLHPHP